MTELGFLKEDERSKSAKIFGMHTLARRLLVELSMAVDPNNTEVRGQFSVRLNEENEVEVVIDTRVISLDGTVSGSLVLGKSEDVESNITNVRETQMVNLQMARRYAKLPEAINDMAVLDKHYNIKQTLKNRSQRVEQIRKISNLIVDPERYDPINCYRLFKDKRGDYQIAEYTLKGEEVAYVDLVVNDGALTICWFRVIPATSTARKEQTHQIVVIDKPEALRVNPKVVNYMPIKL